MSIAQKVPLSNASTLSEAKRLSVHTMKEVDTLILGIVKKEIPLIHDVAEHIIASGGKRLRPLLTLICSEVCGYEGKRHISLAASVEFIHTATLLHDDVVDESKLRRGLATANDVWGNKSSVLVGDFLLSQAFRLMVADGSIEILDILSSAAAVISKGEVLQLTTEGNAETDIQLYYDVIEAKTAELFAAACEIGPVIAGIPEMRNIFRDYGYAIGMAFQIMDDMLDYTADQSSLGKNLGDDFRERKMTLPLILAMNAAKQHPQAKQFFARLLQESDQRPEDFSKALQYMHELHVFDEARIHALKFCDMAENQLHLMPAHPAKKALEEIAQYSRDRLF